MEPEVIVEQQVARRAAHPSARDTDAYRLFNGAADGAPPGLVVERYADVLVVSARAELDATLVDRWCGALHTVVAPRALVLKRAARAARDSTTRVWCGALDGPVVVHEHGARFVCVLDEGQSTGLFLDHRETRQWVRARAAGLEVLNLFAHTCSFSVHAALGGARRVTSVDAARAALKRGRDNMSASGLDPDAHRWFPDDVLAHLERAARRGDAYGVVILDPPSFGRAGGRVHALGVHLERLVELGLAVLAPGGHLVFSTHALELDRGSLRALVRGAAERVGRGVEVEAELGAPSWDHPPLAREVAGDRGDYLKTIAVRATR
jgi:23S rRNA (cytosine1962-C5)-methyltransferase